MLDFIKTCAAALRTGSSRPAPTFAWTTQSATGLVRTHNEDHILAMADECVFCVADGMGGGSEGAKASEMVCRELRMMLHAAADPASRVRAVRQALVDANAAIFAYAAEHGFSQMGSTAAVLAFDPEDSTRATVVHVGDSRVYRIRGGLAEPLTRDHSVGFEIGDFAGKNAATFRDRAHPLSHVLTRAVGVKDTVMPECRTVDVRAGDRFVLCTDGVHDVISNARLAVFAGGRDLEQAKARLTAEIERAGAPDNFSFIIVQA